MSGQSATLTESIPAGGARTALFVFAALTALFAFPLLFVGGLVTSLQVGMAVPDWPTTFEQNMFTYPWLEAPVGVMVEHGHRLLGTLVGLFSILTLMMAVVARAPRSVRLLALTGLCAVIAQGVLGGLRVVWNAQYGRELAMAHGIFGPATFGLLLALAARSRPRWEKRDAVAHEQARLIRWSATGLVGLLWAQIALGASVRHLGIGFIPHLVSAGLLLLLLFWLVFIVALHEPTRRALGKPLAALTVLFVAQLFLGVGALWVTGLVPPGFGPPPKGTEALVTTIHQATGSLLLGASILLSLTAWRRLVPGTGQVAEAAVAIEAGRAAGARVMRAGVPA